MFSVSKGRIRYKDPSSLAGDYTERMNKEYDWMARGYDLFITIFPFWKRWIRSVLPYIRGREILEVSFGNAYLMSRYGKKQGYKISGIDYNASMVSRSRRKLAKKKINATLIQGNVEALPYKAHQFDTVINTMALSGYPNPDRAIGEMVRVLKPGGRLLLVDFDYPADRNFIGYWITRLWENLGDLIKDISSHLSRQPLHYVEKSIGAFKSVHLYVCRKDRNHPASVSKLNPVSGTS